jgi:iron complex transport system ATP-binding protein
MPVMASQSAIELRGVGVLRDERWIVRDIDWSVPAGACVAMLGPNGCGKSTLARVICGYVWPTRGSVSVGGARFGQTDLNALRRDVRLVQAAGPLEVDPEMTAEQVVLTGSGGTLGLYDPPDDANRRRAAELLAAVGLARVAGHSYRTLSSGERVRTLIARAMFTDCRLLILDEPTAGLDLLGREQVLAAVQRLSERDATSRPAIVLITHHVEELPPATSSVLLLSDGQSVQQGSPAEVLQDEVLSRVYGCPVRVEHHDGRWWTRVRAGAWETLAGR